MNEQEKYEIIKKLVDVNRNKLRAAQKLNLSIRQVNRLIKGYKEEGKAFFIHGNRGRQPVNTVPDDVKRMVIDLYTTKYYDANFTHYTKLLARLEGIELSVSTVTTILESQYILSPRVTKSKKKRIKKKLNQKKEQATTQKEKNKIQTNLVAVEDAHSRRPRCAYFGELLQMDASLHHWFGDEKSTLHIAVDDATSTLVGAWFDKEETLNGYYHVFHDILKNYGIPYKFFTDRRTVFTYQLKNAPSLDEDTYTQFAYACKQLGVEIECSSVPQAKGRVERMFQTLQSRLPLELRLAGITTVKEANEFLNSYIKEFNAQFALPTNDIKSVFEAQPSDEKINQFLAVLTERTVDSGHCIQHKKCYYRMLDENGYQVHYRQGTRVLFIEAYDKRKFCCVNDTHIYALEEIPKHESKSKELDVDYKKSKPKKQNIPSKDHPWRHSRFQKFVKQQKHRLNDDALEKPA
ncbi:ISNCY family transposase [Dorea sp. OM02-2LB]|nr:ISNCY family transposase [Dorea sp. OM02-2LB]